MILDRKQTLSCNSFVIRPDTKMFMLAIWLLGFDKMLDPKVRVVHTFHDKGELF